MLKGMILPIILLLFYFSPKEKATFDDLPFSSSFAWIENNTSIRKVQKELPKSYHLIESETEIYFEKRESEKVYSIHFKYEEDQLIGVKFNFPNSGIEALTGELENKLSFNAFISPVVELPRMNGDMNVTIFKREQRDYTAVIFTGEQLKITTCLLLKGNNDSFLKW